MKDLLEFPPTNNAQDEEETHSNSSKEKPSHKSPSKKNTRQKINKKNSCHTKCRLHKTDGRHYSFPKLTPNVDLMLPVILSFLKEHTGNSSYFVELAQREALSKKENSKDSNTEDLLFHLRMCRKSNARIESMLHGLCEYVSFRFHSPKHTHVNTRFLVENLEKELKFFCKANLYSIHLTNNIPAFKSDPECLFTVLKYLIKNSIKRGQNFYKKLVIHIKVKKLKGKVIFYLQDNGDAIKQKEQEYFFSLFEGKNNMDLGAMETAIAYKYIQVLGGNMWIESSSNLKTIICFCLPDKD